MEFDKSKVYTALNADELKIGSKVIVANTLKVLVDAVGYEIPTERLTAIQSDAHLHRFIVGEHAYAFAYLVEEPSKLKWTDLKVGDALTKDGKTGLVALIDSISPPHVFVGCTWVTDEELEEWRKVGND